jgi:hypothetical protein
VLCCAVLLCVFYCVRAMRQLSQAAASAVRIDRLVGVHGGGGCDALYSNSTKVGLCCDVITGLYVLCVRYVRVCVLCVCVCIACVRASDGKVGHCVLLVKLTDLVGVHTCVRLA